MSIHQSKDGRWLVAFIFWACSLLVAPLSVCRAEDEVVFRGLKWGQTKAEVTLAEASQDDSEIDKAYPQITSAVYQMNIYNSKNVTVNYMFFNTDNQKDAKGGLGAIEVLIVGPALQTRDAKTANEYLINMLTEQYGNARVMEVQEDGLTHGVWETRASKIALVGTNDENNDLKDLMPWTFHIFYSPQKPFNPSQATE